jgi:hypothetical protein
MRSKRMLLVLIACVACVTALGVGVGSAQAAWTIEGVELAKGEERPVEITGEGLTLTGSILGSSLEVTSKSWHWELECDIFYIVGVVPVIKCHFKVTSAAVQKPAKCTVHSPGSPSGTLETAAMTGEVIMDPTAGSTAVLVKFFPQSGTKWMELEFGGAECALNEDSAPLKGTFTAQMVHEGAGGEKDVATETGENLLDQSLLFNSTTQTTGGGALTIGTSAATIDATGHMKLTGAFAGKKFGSD